MDDSDAQYRMAVTRELAEIKTGLHDLGRRFDDRFGDMLKRCEAEFDRSTEIDDRMRNVETQVAIHGDRLRRESGVIALGVTVGVTVIKELWQYLVTKH